MRIQAWENFTLHWSADNWQNVHDTAATATIIGIFFVDIAPASWSSPHLTFTFLWQDGHWENKHYDLMLVKDCDSLDNVA